MSAASAAAAATDEHSVHQKERQNETILVQGRRLNVLGKLGEGSYSVVYLVQDPEPPRKRYALKRQLISKESEIPSIIEEIERTVALSHHPFVCSCYAYEISRVEGKHYAVMLQQHGGTPLVAIMKDKQEQSGAKGLGQAETLRLAFQIGSAVSWMHHQEPSPVAHRDLKAENILDQHGVFRLVDFGSATAYAFDGIKSAKDFIRVQNEVASQTTLAYRAPEMCDVYRKHRIDQQVDVWAFGVLLFYVMFFRLPFEETTLSVLAGKVTFPTTSARQENEEYSFDSESSNYPEYDPALVEAVRRCLAQNPAERWSIDACLSFLGEAFPQDEQSVKVTVETMEDDDEDPDLMKPRKGASVKLVAAGAIGQQERSPILCDEASGVSSGLGGDEEEGEEAARRASAPVVAAASRKASGALFSKLKWNAGEASPVSPASPAAVPSSNNSANTNTTTTVNKASSSSVDDLFATPAAPSSSSSAQKAPVFDPFGAFGGGSAPASKPTQPPPSSSFALSGGQQKQQQQQQPAGGGGGIDIFGIDPTAQAAAAVAPKMSFGPAPQQGGEQQQQKKADPFAGLFAK